MKMPQVSQDDWATPSKSVHCHCFEHPGRQRVDQWPSQSQYELRSTPMEGQEEQKDKHEGCQQDELSSETTTLCCALQHPVCKSNTSIIIRTYICIL